MLYVIENRNMKKGKRMSRVCEWGVYVYAAYKSQE